MDINADGNMSADEIFSEFITKYDHDSNGCVSMHEFTHQWNHDYNDNHHASENMYRHLDITSNGCLSRDDMEIHQMAMDRDNDGTVTSAEFMEWMHHVHPDSFGHGHHG